MRGAWKTIVRATAFAGAFALSQAATAGVVILNQDEWTLSDGGFSQAPASTTAFAHNLASTLSNTGGCNLLIHSDNFGLTGAALNAALIGAGCTVTQSLSAFAPGSLSPYSGVLLAGNQTGYDADVLASYVHAGGSVYIGGGTASILNEGSAWDSFTNQFGLDFGPNYNYITGLRPISSSDPLFTGVTELLFMYGSPVSLTGGDPAAEIIPNVGDQGLFGVYRGDEGRIKTAAAVPEPATLALLGVGLAALGLRRRKTS